MLLIYCLLLRNLLTHEDVERKRVTEHTCHVTLCTVYDVTAHAPVALTVNKNSFLYCCEHVFRMWSKNDFLLLLRLGTCLRSRCLEMGIHITLFDHSVRHIILGAEISFQTKSSIFWDITTSSPLKLNRRFRGIFCLHLQGLRISQERQQHDASTFKMEAKCSSETSVDF
jgi:hypothetical protein